MKTKQLTIITSALCAVLISANGYATDQTPLEQKVFNKDSNTPNDNKLTPLTSTKDLKAPTTLPLSHYETKLKMAAKQKPKSIVKPLTHAHKQLVRQVRSHPTAHITTTLPKHLPYAEYLHHVANELGWIDTPAGKNFCPGTYVIPTYIKDHPSVKKNAPIQITATGPEQFKLKGVSVLKGNVVISQPGRLIYADKVYIFRNAKTGKIAKLSVIGHVRIYQKHSLLVSDQGILTLHPRTVNIKNIAYHYYSKASLSSSLPGPFNAWGTADLAKQTAQKVIVLKGATFSTCPPKSPTWQFSMSQLTLDRENNKGEAYNAVLRIKHIPVFYFPYYTFSLNGHRKSGLLFPTIGTVSNAGFVFGLPYYFNLAPNYDLLFTPEYYGRRGFKLNALFRYLTDDSHGRVFGQYLPDDRNFAKFRRRAINTYSNTSLYPSNIYAPYLNALKTEKNYRGIIGVRNESKYSEHWSSRLYVNYVSDPYFLSDIPSDTLQADSTTNQLLNMLQFQYTSSHTDLSSFIQGYQTLHLITQIQGQGQALDQYNYLPSFDATSYYNLMPDLDFTVHSDYTYFEYRSLLFPTRPEGSRFHLRPGLALTLENSAGYIRPEVLEDLTAYSLATTTPGISRNSSRALPIVDIDAGLHFLRDFSFKQESYTQTIEPRLFYLYIPYSDQNNLPNFNTVELPFFFDQLFALNALQGEDRIENANQLSLGLSSSIIQDSTGSKLLSANIGEIYHIQQPRVCLTPGCKIIQRSVSPLVANLTFYPNQTWSLVGNIAWDPTFDITNNASAGLSYHPDGHHIINLSYLYVSENPHSISTFTTINPGQAQNFVNNSAHAIFNFAWPIGNHWSTLGYTDYDFHLKRFDTAYAGLQYDSCCWGIRFIVKRLYDSSTYNANRSLNNTFNYSYFVQFTLKGLGSFGTGSDSLVQSLIPGYRP